jgi:hypothetical protein
MTRNRSGWMVAILLCMPVTQAAELVRKDVLDGKVSMMLPPSFELMSEDMRRLKYLGDPRPPVVYTDPKGTVNVAINHSTIKIPETSMASAKAALEGSLKAQSPNATWLKSEAVTTKARTVIRYDFRNPAADTTIRNIMYGASVDGALLLITFTCAAADEAEWAETGKSIIDSIEIRATPAPAPAPAAKPR